MKKSYKYESSVVFLLSTALLSGCACGTATTSSEQTADRQKFSIAVRQVLQPADVKSRELSDLYIRLKASPPEMPQSITFEQKSFVQLLKEKIGAYLYDDIKTLAVTLDGSIDGKNFGKRSVVMLNMHDKDEPAYGDYFLTPYFRTSNQLIVQWDRSWSKSVDTTAFSTAVVALKGLTSIYAPNGIIFQTLASTTNLNQKIKDVDTKLGKLFSDAETHSDGNQAIDPTKVKGFGIYFNEEKSPAINVEFEYRESLLSSTPSGAASDISARTENIKGWSQSDGTLLKTLIQGNDDQSNLMKLINKNTAQDYARFCEDAATLLSSKGFNYIDSAAILYAYLKDSTWNRDINMRNDQDSCLVKISAGLEKINNPAFKLSTRDDLMVTIDTERKAIVTKLKSENGLWQKDLPTRFASPTRQYVDSLAADEITLLSVRYDFQLADSILLKAGVPVSLSASDLTSVLRNAKLTYNKDKALKDGTIDDSCFSMENMPNSGFKGFCFYPNDGEQAVTIEFSFDANFSGNPQTKSPRLNKLTFFPAQAK